MALEVDQADLAAAMAAPLSDPSGAAPGAAEAPRETFAEQWERLSAADTSSDPESADAPPEGKDGPAGRGKDGKFLPRDGKPAPAKDPAKPAAAVPSADKLAQLKALATELGLEVDEAGPVSRTERAEWRKSMAKKAANLAQREEAIVQRVSALRAELSSDAERFAALSKAADEGDYQAIARAIGKKDWDELVADVQAHFADPHYKRIRELEARQAEVDRREQEAGERQRTAAQQQERAEARQAVLQDVSAKLASSSDPLARELHDHPLVRHAVFQIMEENWDPVSQSTVSPVRAMRMSVRGAGKTLEAEMRDLYDRLHRAFSPGKDAPPEGGTVRRPAPRSAPVPPRASPAPSVTSWTDPKTKKFDDGAFMNNFKARMAEAAELERKQAAAGRR